MNALRQVMEHHASLYTVHDKSSFTQDGWNNRLGDRPIVQHTDIANMA